MAARPLITLTTDFGLRDPFVGIVKGVIVGICRDVQLVDLTHTVAPQNVLEAQIALESAWRFFPSGTIHVAVVDPGVGGSRRALALSAGGHYFVGPDNGLFTFALSERWSAVSIETASYRLPVVSHTFHGRDVFAPAAAHLASGVPLERLGGPVTDPVRRPLPTATLRGNEVVGEVITADHFGNLVTSVTEHAIDVLGGPQALEVTLGSRGLGTMASRYEEGEAGIPRAIVGSSGRIEIFVRNGSAAATLGVSPGTPVTVSRAGARLRARALGRVLGPGRRAAGARGRRRAAGARGRRRRG